MCKRHRNAGRTANRARYAIVWTCLGYLAASLPVAAAPAPQESTTASRPLNLAEGRTIAGVAADHDQPVRGARDCSHLVHQIYLLAGFEYPYASSFELYAGSENFVRVKNPQPGDLIAWPGHVGIILDPARHQFYSLVRSGIEAQDYHAAYWRARGRARFYRYVVESTSRVLTAKAQPAARRAEPTQRLDGASEVEERSESESTASRLPVKEASERATVPVGPPAPGPLPVATEIPTSILITAADQHPTADEVADGVSELSNTSANVLRTEQPLNLPVPLVIFDQLSVEKLEIKRDHGWANIRVDSRVSIAGGNADFKQRHEKVRWELRRTESGWVAVAPQERTYVPHDVAVRILAAQLARLAESDAAARHDDAVLGQEARIANLLSALLESK